MQWIIPPDLETLINKQLSTGSYASAEDVLRHALEAQDAEDGWTEEERMAVSTHIGEGYLQAEKGDLLDADRARLDVQTMKVDWREKRALSR